VRWQRGTFLENQWKTLSALSKCQIELNLNSIAASQDYHVPRYQTHKTQKNQEK
jgi:hypothetical protein